MKILLTGFEPFGGSPLNPSEQVVKALQIGPPPVKELETLILPVDGGRAPGMLKAALAEHQPDAVICLGEAGRSAISLERAALNLLDYCVPDNSGVTITDQPIRPDGPAAYFSTLPLRPIQSALLAAGIPCELSLTAGAYLCNQVFYTLMDTLAFSGRQVPAGFIHLPSLLEQVALRGLSQPSMALEAQVRAIRVVLEMVFNTELTESTDLPGKL